jgi:hypothetical protein
MPVKAILIVFVVFVLTACQVPTQGLPDSTAASSATPPGNLEETPVPIEPSPTIQEPTETQPSISTDTPSPTATIVVTEAPTSTPDVPQPSGGLTQAIIIDHVVLETFPQIPDEYIIKASETSMLFRHASIGWNMDMGLNCLMNKEQPRPRGCDKGVPGSEIVFDNKYDRSNWVFEFHQPPPAQNPGWYAKVELFIDRIDNLAPNETYDTAAFKLGYVDALGGSNIADVFFTSEDSTYPTIGDLEALEARHPEITFIFWTIGLARQSYPESEAFNQQLREYVRANNRILMDIADIESHRPDGTSCFSNLENGVEAICDNYTDEPNAGHLNAYGRLRMAKAFWVLMAYVAGWDGEPAN